MAAGSVSAARHDCRVTGSAALHVRPGGLRNVRSSPLVLSYSDVCQLCDVESGRLGLASSFVVRRITPCSSASAGVSSACVRSRSVLAEFADDQSMLPAHS